MTTTAPINPSCHSASAAVPPIEDTRHRIRNILDVYPPAGWIPEEAQEVLKVLSEIVRSRQGAVGGGR
ncbi:MAG: hypothetical protein QOF88_1599 [Mycobacterium sp.]|jgi:hypothetical protein|nr:hypothetical protein [Mycobacterium sp.]